MKTKNKFLLSLITFFIVTAANADLRVYDNIEDFEKYEGQICEAASDGCNSYFMSDGKVGGGTLMACPQEQKIEWTCTQFKEDVITTKSLTLTLEETNQSNLSDNDLSFYNSIKNTLDQDTQDMVVKIVSRIQSKISKLSVAKQEQIKELIVERIDQRVSKLLSKYPQDTQLPSKAQKKYLTFTLLKFELIK